MAMPMFSSFLLRHPAFFWMRSPASPRPGDEDVPRPTLGIQEEVHSEGRNAQEKLEQKDPIAE